jgi:hypothetical protein
MSGKPYLIVTNGPTGSGKTKLIDETINELNIVDRKYVKVLIDDIIEGHPVYKALVKKIINNVQKKCKRKEECITSKYVKPDEALLKQFDEAYFSTRKNYRPCNNEFTENNYNCDELNDRYLTDAITKKENIVFETQGMSIPFWLFEFVKEDYDIIFSYSLVEFDKLLKRNVDRLLSSIQKFNSDESNPAPRLPDINVEKFSEKVNLIINALILFHSKCIIHETCTLAKIRLLIFDNSDIEMKKIYDSNEEGFEGKLLRYKKVTSAVGTGGARGVRDLNKPKLQSKKKVILGKDRCIYKMSGDRKEYVKCKGKFITVKQYKSMMKKP